MKIYLSSDHAGFQMKSELIDFIKKMDYTHQFEDLGPFKFDKDDDYPDFIALTAKKIQVEPEARGIVIGGSGEGEAMVANRFRGVRAAVFYGEHTPIQYIDMTLRESKDPYEIVKLARAHNDANVLSIGARFASAAEAKRALELFLGTEFSAEERHIRRIKKIDNISSVW